MSIGIISSLLTAYTKILRVGNWGVWEYKEDELMGSKTRELIGQYYRKLFSATPQEIEKLRGHRIYATYRIVGPNGLQVIAKRRKKKSLLKEMYIYENILPALQVHSADFYGYEEEQTGEYAWIFLEDVGQMRFAADNEQHISSMITWLAQLHTASNGLPDIANLPDAGPDYFLEHLRLSRENLKTISGELTNSTSDIEVLKSLIEKMDHLETHWPEIERICEQAPLTLVHGDFAPHNLHIRDNGDIVPIDWECGSRGSPPVDLFIFKRCFLSLDDYWSVVSRVWGDVAFDEVKQWSEVGSNFRTILAIYWLTKHFDYQWAQVYLNKLSVWDRQNSVNERGLTTEFISR